MIHGRKKELGKLSIIFLKGLYIAQFQQQYFYLFGKCREVIDMKKPLKESLLEMGRVIALACMSFVLTEGVIVQLLELTGWIMDPTFKFVFIGLLTNLLRGIDKYLHEAGITEKGIVPF